MENEIRQWIDRDTRGLEDQANHDPSLPRRLKARLSGMASLGLKSQRRLLALVSLYAFILALFTLAHLSWINRLEGSRGLPASFDRIALNPFPSEMQPAFTKSFLEVTRWEK